MTTDVIEQSIDILKEDLIDHINNEPLDMLEEFTDEEIADKVIEIAKTLVVRNFTNGHIIKYRANKPKLDYLYKINNKIKGFVSLSDDSTTGVSRTLYRPFYHENGDWFGGLCCLAEMLNEAYYQLKN